MQIHGVFSLSQLKKSSRKSLFLLSLFYFPQRDQKLESRHLLSFRLSRY